MGLRRIPIRRSGNRDNLLLGGDRELVIFAGIMSSALVFAAQNLLALVLGIVLWVATVHAARLMAKADPKLRQVYLRHRTYKDYYPARATPFRTNSDLQAKRYR